MQEIVVRRSRASVWLRLAINTLAIFLTGQLISGVHVNGVGGALIAAIVITLVNTFVRPILVVLTLPITLMTLGIFILVVNGLSLWLAAWLSGSLFDIDGLGAAIGAWLVFAILNWAITGLFGGRPVTVLRN